MSGTLSTFATTATTTVVKLLPCKTSIKTCEDAHASALAAHSPDASKLTTDKFASAAWRNSLDDTTDGVATNLADRFNECVSYLKDNVFNIDDKQLVRLDKAHSAASQKKKEKKTT